MTKPTKLELDRQIRECRKTSALAAVLKDKLEAQKGAQVPGVAAGWLE